MPTTLNPNATDLEEAETEYIIYLQTQKYSPTTITNHAYLLNQLLKNCYPEFCQNDINQFIKKHNNYTTRSLLKNFKTLYDLKYDIPKIKGRKGQPIINYITPEEIQHLVLNIPDDRYAILIQALYETGCRITEALNWSPLNIDFKQLLIRGIGKGHKPYEVNISQTTADSLSQLTELLDEKETIFTGIY